MTKYKTEYQNTVIYKIVCNDLNITDCYVGHTTNFRHRKSSHKHICSNAEHKDHNVKLYQNIRNNGGWINWSMVEIEKYPCNDSNEAHARERYYYELLNASNNTYYPNRNHDEWTDANKDKLKIYRDENKEAIKILTKNHYDNNKEIYLERAKIYWENNKNILSEKIICECGGNYTVKHRSTHLKTKKHLEFLQTLN